MIGLTEEKEFEFIEPSYVAKFKCDGQVCNSKCCCGWQVIIDEGAVRRFRDLPDAPKAEVCGKLVRNEDDSWVVATVDGHCPFLREDKLCDLRRRFGADILADVCMEYPLKTYRFPHFAGRAMSLTCPVAARLALLEPTPMEFVRVRQKTIREAYFIDAGYEEEIQRISFFTLQGVCLAILQQEKLTPDARLAVLADFLSAADDLCEAGGGRKMGALGETYFDSRKVDKVINKFAGKQSIAAYRQIMGCLAGHLTAFEQASDMANFHDKGHELFHEAKDLLNDEVRFRAAIKCYRQNVLSQYGYVFSNYLVHEFFIGLYPCMTVGSFVHNFRLFLLLYKLWELLLILTAAHHTPTEDDFINSAEIVATRSNHFRDYISTLENFLENMAGKNITPEQLLLL